jgi:hypothetical protein
VEIKNRQQFLTILTLTVVGLLILDKIVSPPLTKLWNSRSARIVSLQNQVKEGEARLRNKESLRAHWAEIQKAALDNDTTASEQQLLTELNNWSQRSGVSIVNIASQPKTGADPAYKTLECRVDASGSIERLSRFLYELEIDPLALRVQSVELTSKDNTGMVIGMGVQISGLVLTAQEPKK